QVGRPESTEGARRAVRVPGLEERRLEGHQFPCQACARPDGALCHRAQGRQARRPAEVRQRGLCLRRVGVQRRQTGVPAQSIKRSSMSAGLRVFLFFSLGYLVSYLFRGVNIGFGPYLTQELNLSAADLGSLTSLYFLGFALMQLPAGLFL